MFTSSKYLPSRQSMTRLGLAYLRNKHPEMSLATDFTLQSIPFTSSTAAVRSAKGLGSRMDDLSATTQNGTLSRTFLKLSRDTGWSGAMCRLGIPHCLPAEVGDLSLRASRSSLRKADLHKIQKTSPQTWEHRSPSPASQEQEPFRSLKVGPPFILSSIVCFFLFL